MKLAGVLLGVFAASAAVWWAAAVWPVLPSGSRQLGQWSLLWIAALIVAMVGLPIALMAAVFRRARPIALRAAAACAAVFVGAGVGLKAGGTERLRRLQDVPARGAPLIAAIRAYERDRGHPPDRLEDLVPGYVAAIPSTGFGGHPAWSYAARPFAAHPQHAGLYGENAWALNLYVADPMVPSYRMVYLPNHQYPGGDGRVGDWVRLYY